MASPSSSREGAILLEVTTARLKLAEIFKKIFDDREGDPEGYNGFISTLAQAAETSLSCDSASDPAAIARSSKRQAPRMSLQQARDKGIIITLRVPLKDVKDVKIGNETLVVNPSFLTVRDTIFHVNQALSLSEVNEFFETRFRELELELEANTVEGINRVPSSVSEGMVPSITMEVDMTGAPIFVPNMEVRHLPQ